MSGVISTGNHPLALWPGIDAIYGRAYKEHPIEWQDTFEVKSSDKKYEEIFEVTGFGLANVKAEGASVDYDTETQGDSTRFVNIAYALGYIVTREELDDNQYEEVSGQRAGALKFSMRQTSENVHANIFNRAFNSSYVGGDGVELISTAHVTKSGTQSNHITTAADLSEKAVEDLVTQVMLTENSRGLKISLMPECLLVHPNDFWKANRIYGSTLQSGTANNDINVLRSQGIFPKGVKVNHYLSDTDAWFVKTNCPNGLLHYDRVAEEFTQDNDFDTENAKAKSYMRFSAGWGDWRTLFGSPGV